MIRLSAEASVRDWQRDPQKSWQAERMAVYAAQVEAIDRGLGQLLKLVDDAGKRNNTLVLFLSDNGAAPNGGLAPSNNGFGFVPKSKNNAWRLDGVPIKPGSGPGNLPGPHDTFAAYGLAWANVSNTPLRGMKSTAYEGGIRTPLVVRWPVAIRHGGETTDRVGHVMDLMATCLHVANAKYPLELNERKPLPLEGKSLLPTLQRKRSRGHDELCWSLPRQHAIRMGSWKAVKPKSGGVWQLFNLRADGTETTDLAKAEPNRVRNMSARFEKWRKRVGAN